MFHFFAPFGSPRKASFRILRFPNVLCCTWWHRQSQPQTLGLQPTSQAIIFQASYTVWTLHPASPGAPAPSTQRATAQPQPDFRPHIGAWRKRPLQQLKVSQGLLYSGIEALMLWEGWPGAPVSTSSGPEALPPCEKAYSWGWPDGTWQSTGPKAGTHATVLRSPFLKFNIT